MKMDGWIKVVLNSDGWMERMDSVNTVNGMNGWMNNVDGRILKYKTLRILHFEGSSVITY